MNSVEALPRALGELATLGTRHDRERLAALMDRVASTRMRLLVVGESKRGKSTLVNALIGRALLPAGVTPLTAVATTLRYGDERHAQVRFLDGHEEKHPLNALRMLVTEPGNPENRRGVAHVIVHMDAPMLARGVELVDTPGTGSVFQHGAEAARAAMDSMDAAVVVLSPDPPMSASEQELLRVVAERSVRTFVVLNKADRLNAGELSEVSGFTLSVLTRSAGIPHRIYAMSALAALNGGDPGFATFTADLSAYLDGERAADLRRSVVAEARRIASSQSDEIGLARRSVHTVASDAAERAERFRVLLAESPIEPRKAITAVSSGSARLLFALNDSADDIAASLVRDLAARLEAVLSELCTARPTDIARRGREWLSTSVTEAIASWYEQQKDNIQEGMAALHAQLTADLRRELGVLRESAIELSGLDVIVPEPGSLLADASPTAGACPGDTQASRVTAAPALGHLPGGLGRRRARDWLRLEIARCVPDQIDAAREALRQQLAQMTDTLVVVARQRFADAAAQVQAALRTATERAALSAAEAQLREAALAGREAALQHALNLLDGAETPL